MPMSWKKSKAQLLELFFPQIWIVIESSTISLTSITDLDSRILMPMLLGVIVSDYYGTSYYV